MDDSWNIDSQWNERFAESLIKENMEIFWYAFMRADFILRDEGKGIFKKLVDSGLSHISVGAERADSAELTQMGKACYSQDVVKECMHMLKDKYPRVFRQVTFIVGTRDETAKSMSRQVEYAKEIAADYPAFHPLTPVPGTELWNEAKRNGWLEITDFRYYDCNTPVMSSKYLSREEIQYLIYLANKEFISFYWIVKGLFSPFKYKRNMYFWWFLVMLKRFISLSAEFVNPFRIKQYSGLIKPKWYET